MFGLKLGRVPTAACWPVENTAPGPTRTPGEVADQRHFDAQFKVTGPALDAEVDSARFARRAFVPLEGRLTAGSERPYPQYARHPATGYASVVRLVGYPGQPPPVQARPSVRRTTARCFGPWRHLNVSSKLGRHQKRGDLRPRVSGLLAPARSRHFSLRAWVELGVTASGAQCHWAGSRSPQLEATTAYCRS